VTLPGRAETLGRCQGVALAHPPIGYLPTVVLVALKSVSSGQPAKPASYQLPLDSDFAPRPPTNKCPEQAWQAWQAALPPDGAEP
jgi:hypothetical protein